MAAHVLSLVRITLVAGVAVASVTLGGASLAEMAAGATVTVTVVDIAKPKGTISAALLREPGWDGKPVPEPVSVARVPVEGDSVTLTLLAPAPGRYAFRLFQDLDGDGKLDANMLGIPSEPYGFSNNAKGKFGPPSFEAAAFDVAADGVSQTISLE